MTEGFSAKDALKLVAVIGLAGLAAAIGSTISTDNDDSKENQGRDWPLPNLKEDYKPKKVDGGI